MSFTEGSLQLRRQLQARVDRCNGKERGVSEGDLSSRVKGIFAEQLYGVLTTVNDAGEPHSSIVAFVSADDLRSIVFVTPRNTRKYRYALARPRVAVFIDDRRDRVDELMQVTGIEACGSVEVLARESYGLYRELYLSKHPAMQEFVDAPGSAIMRIAVERYDVVDRFQHVMVLPPGHE